MQKSGNINMVDYNLGEQYADKFVSVKNEPLYDFNEFSYFGKDLFRNVQENKLYENLFDTIELLSLWAKTIKKAQTRDIKQENDLTSGEQSVDTSLESNNDLEPETPTEPDNVTTKPLYEPQLLTSNTPKETQIGKFNVTAAIKRLHYLTNFDIKNNNPKKWTRKSPTSKARNCARAVRMAMEAGGLSTEGRPRYGGDYGPFLMSHGWSRLDVNATPQAGDICVSHGLGKEGWGHISMYDGSKWVSDYVQKSWKLFSAAKLGTNTYFYRYKG